MLDLAIERHELSASALNSVLRVARTVADLDGSEPIGATHVAEAIQYRFLDRQARPRHGRVVKLGQPREDPASAFERAGR